MSIAEIRARVDDCRTYNFGMRNADKLAKEDVPRLLAAVESVLALRLDLDSNTRYMNPAWINGWEAATQAVHAAITAALEAS